ncbi:hypothetical protein WJX81_008252 [Elliptochloris bilobata]|uniref:Glycoside hydrolase family 5 domain-containing protein n=1 Tax=Elliptochloris bilobata TaxID=381761 RepID=A0AAW1S1T7_9CHLO
MDGASSSTTAAESRAERLATGDCGGVSPHRGRDAGGEGGKHRRAARPAFHATAADAQAAAQWADRSKYGGTLVNRGDSLADLPGLRPPARRPDLAHGNATVAADGEAARLRGRGSIKARMHEVDAPPDATCLVTMKLQLVYEEPYAGYPDADVVKSPSPVPRTVRGGVDLSVFNNGTSSIKVPWTLTIMMPPNEKFVTVFNARLTNTSADGVSMMVVSDEWQTLQPNRANAADVSFLVDASSQDFAPTNASVNGEACTLSVVSDIDAPVPELPGTPAVDEILQPVSIQNSSIIGVDGQPLNIRGINWFGFETSATMTAGLWAGSTSLTADFATVIWRMQLLGFNTVRLPFSFQVLFNIAPVSYTSACTHATNNAVRNSVVPPGITVPGGIEPPLLRSPASNALGVCNGHLPTNSIYTRFLWVIRFLVRNHFYVVLDNQLNIDSTALDDPVRWVGLWEQLLADVVADPVSKARVMVDILNEPDSRDLQWEGSTPPATDVTWYYISAMDAMHQVSPTTLYLIEGCGQNTFAMNWGDGFVTDRELIKERGLSDPNWFFQTLLEKPYLKNVIVSPHYYPPTVSKSKSHFTGEALFWRMTNSFGYLTKEGYGGHVFPVVFGEVGSHLTADNDLQMMEDMAKYLRAEEVPYDGRHSEMKNVIWWAWNANSADTGGLVTSPNWDKVHWRKIEWLIRATDMAPWYLSVGQPTE